MSFGAKPLASIYLHGQTTQHQLELTVDSLIGQTEANFEILIAAADLEPGAAQVVSAYADKRIRVLPDEATCVRAARGWAMASLPAGDLWHTHALAHMGAVLAGRTGAHSVLCAGAVLRDGRRQPLPPNPVPPLATRLWRAGNLAPTVPLADAAAVANGLAGEPARTPEILAWIRHPGPEKAPPALRPIDLFGAPYTDAGIEADRPPTLFVVVDTEAEFNWGEPFARDLTSVSAMNRLADGQAIFERHGVRPIYQIDYPVATQPGGIAAIKPLLARRAAVIGAHLHPWTNPPFSETLSPRLSFPGNLPLAQEARKLDLLYAAIDKSFSTRPPFYKAGRYGLGPNTLSLIAERGARVDFSLLPQTNMGRAGGPDFRTVRAGAYRVGGTNILSVPMTRAILGPLASVPFVTSLMDAGGLPARALRGLGARSGLLERLTLTAEGISTADQIRLIRAEWLRGRRIFVMHFHSPSLAPGNTPYVRDETARRAFLHSMDAVCDFFLNTLGGLPGRPQDLLPLKQRGYGG